MMIDLRQSQAAPGIYRSLAGGGLHCCTLNFEVIFEGQYTLLYTRQGAGLRFSSLPAECRASSGSGAAEVQPATRLAGLGAGLAPGWGHLGGSCTDAPDGLLGLGGPAGGQPPRCAAPRAQGRRRHKMESYRDHRAQRVKQQVGPSGAAPSRIPGRGGCRARALQALQAPAAAAIARYRRA